MIKALILAACFVGYCGQTQAGTIIMFDYCGIKITKARGTGLYQTEMWGSHQYCPVHLGAGIGAGPVDIEGFGQAFVIGFNADDYGGSYSGEYMLVFAYPFVTGGKFIVYNHKSGTDVTTSESGTYTVVKQ